MNNKLFLAFVLFLNLITQCWSVHDVNLPCKACVNKTQSNCTASPGCMWVPQTSSCENSCGYTAEETCGYTLSATTGVGCFAECQWLAGSWNKCVPRDNFHFDICMVLDASDSITQSEWAGVKRHFVTNYLDAVTLPTCDLADSNSIGCPHVGIVQFDKISQVILPDLSSMRNYYSQVSSCFDANTTLPRLPLNWRAIVDGMQLARNQSSRVDAHVGTDEKWTLEGVQRCADLLLNTHRAEPRSLSTIVVITDSDPTGPMCGSEVCAISEANPSKQYRIDGTMYDRSCQQRYAGVSFTETNQSAKLLEADMRPILVELKINDLSFVKSEKIESILSVGHKVYRPIGVVSDLLSPQSAGAALGSSDQTKSSDQQNSCGAGGRWFGAGVAVGASLMIIVGLVFVAVRYFRLKQRDMHIHRAISQPPSVDRRVSLQESEAGDEGEPMV